MSSLADLVREVMRGLRGHDLVLYAAGLTFYAGIAVVPLLLLAVYCVALVIGEQEVARLGERLAEFLPDRLGMRGAIMVLTEVAPRLGVGSLLAALIPASTYGEGLARVFDRLAGSDAPRAPGLWGRVKSVVLLAGLPLVVAVGFLTVAVLPEALGLGQGARLLGLYLNFLIGWVSSALLLAVVYRAFSRVPLRRRALFWGTASAGSFLVGMSLGWVYLLGFDVQLGSAYGGFVPIATGVLAGAYLFLVQIVLLAGYVLTLRLSLRADARRGS